MITYNVNHELTLVNLLGLDIERPKKGNIFKIIDKSKKKVGYIEILDEFTIRMEIKTDRLSFSEIHHIQKATTFDESKFNYTFTVQNHSGINYNVSLNIGSNPFIHIKDQDGHILASFLLTNTMMYLSLVEDARYFRRGRLMEVFLDNPESIFDNLGHLHKGKMFVYETTYDNLTNCSKNIKRTRFIAYRNNSAYREAKLITEKSIFSGEREVSHEKDDSPVYTTIADLLSQEDDAKNLVTDFRLFLNSVIPFVSDVLLTILRHRGLPEYPFNILIEELKHPVNLSHYQFVKNIKDNICLGLSNEVKPNLDICTHCDIIYNDGTIYDFGTITNNYLNQSYEKGSFGIYQDFLLKYFDDTTLSLAFDVQSRTFINDPDQLKSLESEIKKHTHPCKTRIKINKRTLKESYSECDK